MKQTSISNAVEVLFCKLEILSTDHDELTDTDVREAIHLTLNYFTGWRF
ncbi:hypothetical protein K9N68_34520 (plasmid) [Kovacikia minuta CCNUW1]|nr:hypothetical protein [Kovacikia minuta]UBF30326.1 hypothetical protein K9N68_34520 [Kovacikia minuta CCNUW1]